MYLFEEMGREVSERASRGLIPYPSASPPKLVYGWMIDTSSSSAKLTWHTDHEKAMYSVICQCDPTETSLEIAKEGEIFYGGVGSFIMFPSSRPHRSLRSEGASTWKIAGFFA